MLPPMAISNSSLIFPSLLLAVAFAASALVGGGSAAAFACGRGSATKALPFCQPGRPIRERARDLIARLTVAEKVAMLVNNAAGVPRLGIPRYEWWSEALHGVAVSPGVHFGGDYPSATSFPQVISSAATFNASLWELMGKVVSDEARALYNSGRAGLTYWSPNVNIYRDPRWGRGQETPGEDPAVSARYAAAYVRGLQQPSGGNRGLSRLKVAACCKHYTAYDLDNWKGYDRFHFNAKVSKQDLEDTYNVPFKACVLDGGVASVMCSYNQVNGVPSCADPNLLRNTIRGQWRLNGYIVSDCDSVGVFYNAQHYGSRPEDAVAYALKAGLDLDCGPFLAQYTENALRQGKVSEANIDSALTHTVAVQMRLGLFDGENQPFRDIGLSDLCSNSHRSLALEAARQAIVLLKNRAKTLPLSPSRLRTVAVIGPNSDATATMIGNYAGIPCAYTSPLKGIASYARTVHAVGCTSVACAGEQPVDAAVEAARHADAVVLVVGLDLSIEAEGRDRFDLLLPGRQQELITAVAKASKGPTVLVLMSGGPLDVSFAEADPNVAAILWAGYPGQAGGAAIADVIFGAHNPGGKLPVTWYPQFYVDKVAMTDMAMRANPSTGYPGRSYRFYSGPVVYPFGHGLSYSVFTHSLVLAPSRLSVRLAGTQTNPLNSLNSTTNRAVRVKHARCNGLAVPVHVDVTNAGDRDGAHAVLVYWRPPAGHAAAARQLVAFEKVHVAAGERVRVALGLDVCTDLTVADVYGVRRIPLGDHSFEIGELTHTLSLQGDSLQW
ncbi:beta-D-xylosidase 1-like [Zingiber officinale]|uniref:Fibronectin type III-like domain-containing protein n=1 Tax=Zingiber officinale TaxID=94328 RepID=A0A8J5FXT7_ZINOF|nr:beta-D-xylosidase 1-like [Zingiber officinale]KAG6487661.1 hypothetical protein ZIOFF_056252 [Zingiber officinale]